MGVLSIVLLMLVSGPVYAQNTDANIFYLIDAAHVADSTAGSLAASKGTSSEVREFGKLMMRDHHAMRVKAQELAKRINTVPTSPPGDSSATVLQRTMNTLNSAAKGRDFDKAYLDNEYKFQLQTLEMLTTAMRQAQDHPDPQLKFHIQKIAPIILSHLDKVKQIR